MRKMLCAMFGALLLAGCAGIAPTPIVVYVTVVAVPTSSPPPTFPAQGQYPTRSAKAAAVPTVAPSPARTVSLTDVEEALADDGYTRGPFYDEEGETAFAWTKNNPYEQVITWADGTVRLEVLNGNSAETRLDHMEDKLRVLDSLFPAKFMATLRLENERYNASVGPSVSGDADRTFPPPPGDEWRTVWARYNTSVVEIDGYEVLFSQWFYQITCPPQYAYCYMNNFPGQEFTGDTSFVFYSISIRL